MNRYSVNVWDNMSTIGFGFLNSELSYAGTTHTCMYVNLYQNRSNRAKEDF